MKFELQSIVISGVNNREKSEEDLETFAFTTEGDPTIFNVIIRDDGSYNSSHRDQYGIKIDNVTIENLKGGTGALLYASFERYNSSLNISASSFNSI